MELLYRGWNQNMPHPQRAHCNELRYENCIRTMVLADWLLRKYKKEKAIQKLSPFLLIFREGKELNITII